MPDPALIQAKQTAEAKLHLTYTALQNKYNSRPTTHQRFEMANLEPVHFFDLYSDLPGPQP